MQIKRIDNDEIVKEVECSSERSADRVYIGMNINLNHDDYYVEIVEVEDNE